MENYWAYTNNGLASRAIPAGETPAVGEVVFDHIPTDSELLAAFPNYTIASNNASLNAQIRALETASETTNWPRATRELIALTPSHGMNAKAAELDAQIVTLRQQIQQVI